MQSRVWQIVACLNATPPPSYTDTITPTDVDVWPLGCSKIGNSDDELGDQRRINSLGGKNENEGTAGT